MIYLYLFYFFIAIVTSQAQQNSTSTVPSIGSNTRFNDELVGHVVAAGGVTTLTSTGSMGISGTPGMSPPLPLVEPKFNYVTFNTTNSSQIMSMIVINSQVICFTTMLLSYKNILIIVYIFIKLLNLDTAVS
jgi:hypothetical protein